jgi:hypothetical protein
MVETHHGDIQEWEHVVEFINVRFHPTTDIELVNDIWVPKILTGTFAFLRCIRKPSITLAPNGSIGFSIPWT